MQMQLRKITSRDNDRLKYARRVRDGRVDDLIFLEGVRLVAEAVRSRIAIESLFIASDAVSRVEELVKIADAKTVYEISDQVFHSLADTKTSQGIIAIARRPPSGLEGVERSLETSALPLVVFLHGVNNPSNLGAVIRSAEAAGAAGVIASEGSADAFSPKALRAAMGSSLRLPVWVGADLESVLGWAKAAGLRSTAADIDATVAYTEVDWRRPRLIILGSEASGLTDADRHRADELILIPMENKVESLNLAVACGIVLFEAKRQVRSP